MKNNKLFLMLGLASALLAVKPVTAYATENMQKNSLSDINISKLKAAAETDKLVLVVGEEGYKVTVGYYEKQIAGKALGPGIVLDKNAEWKTVFITDGVYGRNGATTDKKEGDGKSPIGTFHFNKAFGLKEDPGSVLPYHKVVAGDYWVDDSNDKNYNRLVNTSVTQKTWNSAENLAAASPYYNYALSLDYNEEAVPGKGSAIFLHCPKTNPDTASSGCVGIPENYVIQLLQSVDEKTEIVIAADQSQLEYQQ